MAIGQADLAHQTALLAAQEAPHDLALDHRLEDRNVRRPLDQTQQAYDRFQEIFRCWADTDDESVVGVAIVRRGIEQECGDEFGLIFRAVPRNGASSLATVM